MRGVNLLHPLYFQNVADLNSRELSFTEKSLLVGLYRSTLCCENHICEKQIEDQFLEVFEYSMMNQI